MGSKGLFVYDSSLFRLGFCTGVLIGKNIGLTAAHCGESHNPSNGFKVIFGLNRFASSERTRIGKKFVKHPEFTDKASSLESFNFDGVKSKKFTMNMHNDIAIFSFYGDLPADAKPELVISDTSDLSNQPVYIYGSGHSAYINGVQFREPRYYNSGEFGNLRRGKAVIHADYSRFTDLYFTAPTSESFTCMGDSGGPQFLASASFPTIVGINSAMLVDDLDGNNKDSVCGNTAITTKVSHYFVIFVFKGKLTLH